MTNELMRHCEKPGSAWESSTWQSMPFLTNVAIRDEDGFPRSARNDELYDPSLREVFDVAIHAFF